MAGGDALAERTTSAWEQRAGRPYDPWADVMSIVGVLDGFRSRKDASSALIDVEATLASAVAALTG